MRPVWLPGPERPPLPRAPTLHVWRTDLDRAPLPAPSDEAGAAVAHATSSGRRRRAAGRHALRRVLARYGDAPREEIALTVGPHGKPDDPAGSVRFNLTHTGALLLVAVSADREVGVDAERTRDRGDVVALARHGLTEDDRAALTATPPAARTALFHRLWVRREAAVKCHGTGLGAAAPDAPVTLLDVLVDGTIPAAIAASGTAPIAPAWFVLDG